MLFIILWNSCFTCSSSLAPSLRLPFGVVTSFTRLRRGTYVKHTIKEPIAQRILSKSTDKLPDTAICP